MFRIALAVLSAGLPLAVGGGNPSGEQARSLVVHVSGLGFQPATLTVSAGRQVTWSNDDLIVHTVTAGDGSFDSGDLAGGKSWTFVPRKKGTFRYTCRYHPNMTGMIVVQ